MTEWRWTDERGVQRLVGTDELRLALASNVLPPTTLVWREGMKEWAQASTIPELSGATGSASPGPAVPRARPGASAPRREQQKTLVGISSGSDAEPQGAPVSMPIVVPSPGGTPEPGRAVITQIPRYGAPDADGRAASPEIPKAPRLPAPTGLKERPKPQRKLTSSDIDGLWANPVPDDDHTLPLARTSEQAGAKAPAADPRPAAEARPAARSLEDTGRERPRPPLKSNPSGAAQTPAPPAAAEKTEEKAPAGPSSEDGPTVDMNPTGAASTAAASASTAAASASTTAASPSTAIASPSTAIASPSTTTADPPRDAIPQKLAAANMAAEAAREKREAALGLRGAGPLAATPPTPATAPRAAANKIPAPKPLDAKAPARRPPSPPLRGTPVKPPSPAQRTRPEELTSTAPLKLPPPPPAAPAPAPRVQSMDLIDVLVDEEAPTFASGASSATPAPGATADRPQGLPHDEPTADLPGGASPTGRSDRPGDPLSLEPPPIPPSMAIEITAVLPPPPPAEAHPTPAAGQAPQRTAVTQAPSVTPPPAAVILAPPAVASAAHADANAQAVTPAPSHVAALQPPPRAAASPQGFSAQPHEAEPAYAARSQDLGGALPAFDDGIDHAVLGNPPVAVPVSSLLGAGGALIFMVISAFFVGRCSAKEPPPIARPSFHAAPALARAAIPPPPKPCWVARQPVMWAPRASKSIPFDVVATAQGALAVGYARDASEAVGIEVSTATGELHQRYDQKIKGDIDRVTPMSSAEFQVVSAEGGGSLTSMVPVPAPKPFFIGIHAGAISAADSPDGAATELWPITGAEGISAARVQLAGDRGYAVTFRREGSIWSGWISPDHKPVGALTKVVGSGGSLGKPNSGWNRRELAVIFADKPEGSDHWEIRVGRAPTGQVPSTTQVIPLPKGGPGGDAFAPDIAGLPDGRWLMVWTEGASGSRAIRAQTFAPDFTPLGDPIALSPPAGNFGQGVLGVVENYAGAVFLSKGSSSYELWGSILQCG